MTAHLEECQGEVEAVFYHKRDDGRHYQHAFEQPNEMLLVTLEDDRRAVLIVPKNPRIPLWERE